MRNDLNRLKTKELDSRIFSVLIALIAAGAWLGGASTLFIIMCILEILSLSRQGYLLLKIREARKALLEEVADPKQLP